MSAAVICRSSRAETHRMWAAAVRLDRLRGDAAASDWTADKVRELIRVGRAQEPAAIARLADALEARLAKELCGAA